MSDRSPATACCLLPTIDKEARAQSSGEVSFVFDANTAGPRHASIRIVNEIVAVTQERPTR
jgi:hypothetical protein